MTKSTGTTFAGFRPDPIRKKIPGDGVFSIAVSVKYGPSNFPVSPVRESPTTIDGRYVVTGSPERATSISARNFVSS